MVKRTHEHEGGADEKQDDMQATAESTQENTARASGTSEQSAGAGAFTDRLGADATRERARLRGREKGAPDGLVSDVSAVTTAAVVGTAAALIEAELIPGIVIGAAAMLVGKMFPRAARGMRPVAKMIIRGGIAATDKARELVAESGEQVQDMMAEVRAERDQSARNRARSPAGRGERAAAGAAA